MEPIFIILIGPRVKKKFFCLALGYSTHLFIDVHCSNEVKKKIIITLAPLLDGGFLCFGGAKIAT